MIRLRVFFHWVEFLARCDEYAINATHAFANEPMRHCIFGLNTCDRYSAMSNQSYDTHQGCDT
jgi:hypothetical protein